MPTYDYECAACGKTFELYQTITERPRKKCALCGRLKARRLIGSGGALIFRGSGFYKTDYRSAEYKQQAKAEKNGVHDAKPAADKPAAAKPAAKKD